MKIRNNDVACAHLLGPSDVTSKAGTPICVYPVWAVHMATNLVIDPQLLDKALKVGGERTKKATVTTALEEYIARREKARIVEHFGTLDLDSRNDHKADRQARDGKLDRRG